MADDTGTGTSTTTPPPATTTTPPPGGAANGTTGPTTQQDDPTTAGLLADLRSERQKRQKLEADLETERKSRMTAEERVVAEAKAAGRAEAAAEFAAERARLHAMATAAGKVVDPGDAVALLGDLSRFVDKSGDIDAKEIEKAVSQLVKDKPYLAPAGTKPGPLPGGGQAPTTGQSFDSLIRDMANRRR